MTWTRAWPALCAGMLLVMGCARAAPAPEPLVVPAADASSAGGDEAASPPGRELRLVQPELVGMDSRTLAEVDSIILRAILDGATPGAALAMGRHGRLVRLRGYGSLDWRAGFAPATDSSIYDLASLTKVVGTTTAAMILVEEGKLDLDAPVWRYLPEWPAEGDKRRVTVRHLLTHTSGLPAYAPLWRELRGREAYVRRIASMDLDAAPGTQTVYSDFGIMLLGFIIERQSGQTLDVFLRERVFEPLGMRDTGFNPRSWGAIPVAGAGHGDAVPERADGGILARIAPTEKDTFFRHTHVHGIVHDENAYALGGVAGHAGLFSSARDLAVFAQMMLDGGEYAGVRILDSATVARFTRRQSDASSRALGWDTPSGGANGGAGFSPRSYGHTGFTGTSIWIDPELDLFVVLLTNRVNPTRNNNKHIALRKAVHETVVLAITDAPTVGRAGQGEP